MKLIINHDIINKLEQISKDLDTKRLTDFLQTFTKKNEIYIYAAQISFLEKITSTHKLTRFLKKFKIKAISAISADCELEKIVCNTLINNQLYFAMQRLGDEFYILSDDDEIQQKFPRTITSSDFIAGKYPQTPTNIDFIDLKTQQQRLRPQIEKNIFEVLRHGQYIMGAEIAELENRLAEFTGAKHAIAVSSGTDSLLAAMMALDIGVGDEVITTPYTWISTAEMIALLGAKPVFVDIDARTFNIDATRIEAAITPATKAIMPVSIYGQCADMDAINTIAAEHNLPVIEDAAQSLGATYKNRQSGNLSLIGSTSLFPAKPLGCYGDGGALFTSDDDLANKMRQIRNHGQKRKHHHPLIGLNARFDTIQAAITLPKLEIFPEECELRARVADYYNQKLNTCADIVTPFVPPSNTCVYAQYTILCPERDLLQKYLASKKIPSVPYYIVPLHLQPCFAYLGHSEGEFPVAEKISSRCISLPMSPYLQEENVEYICENLLTFFKK